jgi:molybdopterin converting factor small subunit
MTVQVMIPTVLRVYTDGNKTVTGSGGTLGEVLSSVTERHPRLRDNFYINDVDVRFTGHLDSRLTDGDAVTILPAVAGG